MNRQCFLKCGFFACVAGLGFSSVALGQGSLIAVDKNPLVFASVPAGAVSAPQTLKVSATPPGVSVQIVDYAPWLQFSQVAFNVGEQAAEITVSVNASALPPGNHQGSFKVAQSGTATNTFTVNVQATVQGVSVLSANPASASFVAQAGAGQSAPTSTTVTIASSGGALNYTLLASATWIGLSASSGTTGSAGFTINANPAGLTPGVYTGNVLVSSTTSTDTVQIGVTLTVNANATLSISPVSLAPFLYRTGGTVPDTKSLTISSSGGPVALNVTQSPATSWLAITQRTEGEGAQSAIVTLSVNPAGLLPGTYSTSLVVTPTGGSPLVPIPVKLVVSSNPILQLSESSLRFSSVFGAGAPTSKTVRAMAAGGAIGYSVVSNQPWLTVAPATGTTDSSVTVAVNPAGLPVGTSNGTLTFTPSNGDSYSIALPVSYEIVSAAQLTAGPGALLFTHTLGLGGPPAQPVLVDSVGKAVSFSIGLQMTTCGQNWLYASSDKTTTPATISISVNVNGQTPGVCVGAVLLTYNTGSGWETLSLPVTLAIAENSVLRVALPEGFGVVTVVEGQQPPPQTISMTSTDVGAPVNFNITATSTGGPWLPSPGSGSTPKEVPISFAASGLAPGVYKGSINIESALLPSSTFTVPVVLRVDPNITVSLSPSKLTFNQAEAGSLPPPQNITLTSSRPGATFIASITQISGDWLQLDRTSGDASGTVAFSIKPGSLPQNSYSARVRFAFQKAITEPIDVDVVLNVGPAQSITLSSSSLTFNYAAGGGSPVPQTVQIAGSSGAVTFSVGTTSSGWLSATPNDGTTPQTLTISANPQGLASGTYEGTISVTGPSGSPRTIAVKLNVTAPPAPAPTTITNSANGQAGPIAPGELITIKGTNLGPASPLQFSVIAGTVPTTLGNLRVLFDGIPGTPLYVSAGQINVIAPYEIAGRLSVSVVVEYLSIRSPAILLQVVNVTPAIFTSNSQGFGQAAALNANGTFNTPESRAPAGTPVVLYGTGAGQSNPPSVSHSVTPTSQFRYYANVTARIGGMPATVSFAGAAPGLVTGVIQLNLIPDPSVHGAELPVDITVNGVTSPAGPTVAVQ